jgi:predicted DNA-binding transcriptional regulator YafY
MYTPQPKKITIIAILDILNKYSDGDNRLSAQRIIDLLWQNYNIKIDRKAVKRNLMVLVGFGYPIEYNEISKKNSQGEEENIYKDWYIEHKFDPSELRLLIDSLLFSKHIPYSQCRDLIEKLVSLSNKYFEADVHYIHNLTDTLPRNKEVLLTIEVLNEAIRKKKQVAFNYREYDTNKERRLKTDKNGEVLLYKRSPYQMVATNGRYYLICSSDKHKDLANYRIDRIVNIELLKKEKARPLSEIKGAEHGLNLPKHMAEHIYMYSGEGIRVKFLAHRSIMDDLVDWFGFDFDVREKDAETIEISVIVNEDAMFNWAMQYGGRVEVLSPKSLRGRLAETSSEMAKKYAGPGTK